MIVPTLPQALLLFFLGGVFVHFMQTGARTFYWQALSNEIPAQTAGILCVFTGAIPIWFVGLHQVIRPLNRARRSRAARHLGVTVRMGPPCDLGPTLGIGWGQPCPRQSAARGLTGWCGILST